MPQSNGGTQPAAAVISAGVVVTGNVACDGHLQISGQVDGSVHAKVIFIDETGTVDGSIEAEQLRVCGTVSGEIVVNDLAVEAGGSVGGETSYQRLKVASGAVVQGNLVHRPPAQAAEGEAPLKLVQPTPAPPVNPRHVFID